MTLLANPKAIAANRRYLDRDLNRCFAPEDLNNPHLTGCEDLRAKEIVKILGDRDRPKVDFILDLHSTTSKMGLTIFPSTQHPFNLQLAAYLSQINPFVRVCFGERDSSRLRSLCPWGLAIEVGAISQSILDAQLFQTTEMLIYQILDYLEAYNLGNSLPVPPSLEIYHVTESIDYPRNAVGDLHAIVHPQLQGRDYQPLSPGDPMFLTWDETSIPYEGKSTVFPLFINEAAYYEKGIAMMLTHKKVLEISP